MRAGLTAVVGVILITIMGSCAYVPALEDATGSANSPVLVSEIVDRIKCEIADAFSDKLNPDYPGYVWLKDWTIKADLTLQANQQGGISPSGTYTSYQRSAVNTAAGPAQFGGTTPGLVQQFFTFSANANFGEQAVRTETLSFSLSLQELIAEHQRRQLACSSSRVAGLVGNLGLREWVDASLESAKNGELLAGTHPSPGTGTKQSSPQLVGKPSAISGASAGASVSERTDANVAAMQAAVAKAVRAEFDASNSFETIRQNWRNASKQLAESKRLSAGYLAISTPESGASLEAPSRRCRSDLGEVLVAPANARYASCAAFPLVLAQTSHAPAIQAIREPSPGNLENVCARKLVCEKPQNLGDVYGARMSLACTLAARDEGDKNDKLYAYWLSVAQSAATHKRRTTLQTSKILLTIRQNSLAVRYGFLIHRSTLSLMPYSLFSLMAAV